MKAICITSRPGVGELDKNIEFRELPLPEPGRNEVRIRVKASTVNVDDVHMAEGTMFGGLPVTAKPTGDKPYIPGTDVAGIVDAVGPGVLSLRPGQEVYGICNPMKGRGPWAEYCIAHKDNITEKPPLWNFQEAASCALAGGVTVSMINAVKNLAGKKCLVIGASGGIGTLCIQALKNSNARDWGVCSGKNSEMVQRLGAERVIDYTKGSFSQQLKAHDEKVDVVFDLIGGKELEKEAYSILEPGGSFVTVVGPNKYVGERYIGIAGALSSFIYIGWRMVRTRIGNKPKYVFTGPTTLDFASIKALLADWGSKPIIDSTVALNRDEISGAIRRIVSHRAAGKVVIAVED